MFDFKSRKWRAMVAVILGSVAAALTGEVTWAVCLATSTSAVIGYIMGTAIEDAGFKAGLGKKS